MDFLDILIYGSIFYSAVMAFLIHKRLNLLFVKVMEREQRSLKISDDIRHITMVVERTSAAIAGLNVHKNDIMDAQKDISKLQAEVKSLQVPVVSSPLPPLKKKDEKPYVKVKY